MCAVASGCSSGRCPSMAFMFPVLSRRHRPLRDRRELLPIRKVLEGEARRFNGLGGGHVALLPVQDSAPAEIADLRRCEPEPFEHTAAVSPPRAGARRLSYQGVSDIRTGLSTRGVDAFPVSTTMPRARAWGFA